MTQIKQFLAFTDDLLREELPKLRLSKIKKLAINLAVSEMFERNDDPEQVYYELLDYLEANPKLAHLTTKIEMYFLVGQKA